MSDYYKTYVNKNAADKLPEPVTPVTPVTPPAPPTPAQPTTTTTAPNPMPTPVPNPQPNTSPSQAPIYLSKKGKFPIAIKKVLNPWVLASLLIIVSTGGGAFLILNSNVKLPNFSSVLGAKTEDESTRIIKEVEKLIILPTGESPTVANITNAEQFKIRNPFFEVAQDGDKLLVFSKKVIIYRPSEKRIVDVSQVNLQTTPTSTPDLPSANPLTP